MDGEFLEVEFTHLRTEEGGRSSPIYCRSEYRPHFRTGPTGEYLGIQFVDGPEVVPPGQSAVAIVEFLYRESGIDYSSLVPGATFEVMEGRRIVARGRVLRRWTEPQSRVMRAAT